MKVKDLIKWLHQYEDDRYEAVFDHGFSEKKGEFHLIDIYEGDINNEENWVDQILSDTDY